MELFRRLHRDGQTILLVTHDDDVATAADRVVQMRDGRLAEDGIPEPAGAPASSLFGPILEAPRRDGER
jgi:putative ABC transport system ATP-binding protein